MNAAMPWKRLSPRVCLGLLLLCNYAVVCWVKWFQAAVPELCWISHLSLPLAGVALIVHSRPLLTAVLILVLAPHALWLADFITWAMTRHSPMGITRYLADAEWDMWLGTIHHLYLLPLLLIVFGRDPRVHEIALPLAAVIFVAGVLWSRTFLPPRFNVNYAWRLLPGVDAELIRWINTRPGFVYVPGMLLFVIFVFFTPTAWLLRVWAARGSGGERSPRAPAEGQAVAYGRQCPVGPSPVARG